MNQDYSSYILSKDLQYSIPGLNQIMFISHKQTLSLVCIPVKPATYSGFKFTTFNPFPFYKSPLFKWQVSSRIF